MKIRALIFAAVFALPTVAVASDLKPNKYVAAFGLEKCGVLTIPAEGEPSYRFGSCELNRIIGAPEYTARRVAIEQRDGKYIVTIDEASYEIERIGGSILMGTWTLGNDVYQNMVFRAQPA